MLRHYWLCLAVVLAGLLPGLAASAQGIAGRAVSGPEDNSESIAVVIGNRSYGSGVVAVEYAHNDAEAMRSWLVDGLSFRPENVIVAKDATLARLYQIFGRPDRDGGGELSNRVARARPGRANVFVFYSGHGAPDLREAGSGERPAYLIPIDVDPGQASEGYGLDELARKLEGIRKTVGPERWVVLMLDACFSGASGGGTIVRTSGNFTPRALDPMGGIVRVSATQRDQVANWDEKLKLGLLTSRFLLGASGELDEREVEKRNGVIAWSSLANYAKREVLTASRVVHNRDQEPEIDGAPITMRPAVVPQIRPAIAAMKDEAAWRRAQSAGTRQAYEEYLAQCTRDSPCRFKQDALERFSNFRETENLRQDRKLWEDAQKARRPDQYLKDCEQQRTGCFFRELAEWEAKRQPNTAEPTTPRPPETPVATVDKDTKLFDAARALNTVQAYQAYLDQFPDGFYAAMARAAIERLKPRVEASRPPEPQTPTYSPPVYSPPSRPSYHYVTGLDPTGWNWLALRSRPSYQAPWSTTKMGPGTLLTVLGRQGEWLHVRLQNGETGWANSRYVSCCRQ
jgi:hypothetical protein